MIKMNDWLKKYCFHIHKSILVFDKIVLPMDEIIYEIFKVQSDFALKVWFSIYL